MSRCSRSKSPASLFSFVLFGLMRLMQRNSLSSKRQGEAQGPRGTGGAGAGVGVGVGCVL